MTGRPRYIPTEDTRAVRFEVIDRDGASHLVLFAEDGVYGYDNLGHHLGEDKEARVAFVYALLTRVRASDSGTYQGYLWRRLPTEPSTARA